MNDDTENDNIEAQLLAAHGAVTADASHYEESVIRDAKLRSAPQITLPHTTIANNIVANNHSSSKLVPCGEERPTLPDLSSLGPSSSSSATTRRKGAAAADVPHVLKVLSRTRNALQAKLSKGNNNEDEQTYKREIDLLRMKEQILLGYLTNVAELKEDDAIIPQSTIGSSRKRRRGSANNMNTADDYYGTDKQDNSVDLLGDALSFGEGRTKLKISKKVSKKQGKNDTQMSSTNRLDRIKNGEQLHSTSSQKLKRRTMQSMKSQMRVENGFTPLKSMDEERFDAAKSKKRREERKKRRLKRQRAALGIESESEQEAEFEDDDDVTAKKKPKAKAATSILKKKTRDEENGEEKKSDDNDGMKESGVSWAASTNDKPNSVTNASPKGKKEERTYTKVFCPICSVILTVDHNEEDSPDEYLAKHITECQKTSNSRTGGRSLRKRRKPAVVDLDNAGMDGTDEDVTEAFVPIKSEQSDNFDDELHGEYEEEKAAPPSKRKAPPTSIDDVDEYDYEDRVDDWIEHGLDKMNKMAEQDSNENPPGSVIYEGGLEVPAWINNRLFPYQRTGVRWMWELHTQGAGGVVGDEMGLGKTVQVASFLGSMASNRLLDSVLIIAPATMLSHWLRELAVWAPGLRRILVHRSGESDGISRVVSKAMLRSLRRWLKNARADRVNEPIDDDDYNNSKEHSFCGTGYVIVTTYESIRRSPDEYINHNWSYVVMDEGQKIRNPDADVTLACKRLRTPHRLLLSGTPIQNDLRELWSLFDFIYPGRLGTLPAFDAEFAEPIKRGGYSNASPMQVQLAYRMALVLRDLINPYLLRRQKKDVKEVNRMPSKTEQVLFCRLSSVQRRLYEDYLRSDEVMGVMRGAVQLLKAVTIMRKICNHPNLVTGSNGTLDDRGSDSSSSDDDDDMYDQDKLAERSGKLQVLSKILPLWKKQGHKVIIFTQWKKMLSIIEQFANLQGWKYCRMDGNTAIASRQKLVDKFNNDESYFCMLMTTRTGGVGLNITGANRVLLYDPDWNPQTDAQARERAYRFGQTRDVTVYRLITAGTVEEKIYQRQIFKTALTNQVLQDPKQRRLFSQKDLKDLFTLKADTKDNDNITETGQITKGGGVVDMNTNEANESEDQDKKPSAVEDNSETLEAVIKGKGLCGVFDHDFVESVGKKKKPLSVLEMEENATKVANKAAAALRKSSENNQNDRFEPTWRTGSNETRRPSAAPSNGNGAHKMSSSSSLLANLQNKRMQIAEASRPIQNTTVEQDEKYSALLLRIKKYIHRKTYNGQGPKTREILGEFSDVPDSEAAVFRKLLKSVARVKDGRWALIE